MVRLKSAPIPIDAGAQPKSYLTFHIAIRELVALLRLQTLPSL